MKRSFYTILSLLLVFSFVLTAFVSTVFYAKAIDVYYVYFDNCEAATVAPSTFKTTRGASTYTFTEVTGGVLRPERKGYNFKYWIYYYSQDHANDEYYYGSNYEIIDVNKNMHLHAIWEAIPYHVKFMNGDALVGSRTVYYGTQIKDLPIISNDNPRQGFNGWNISNKNINEGEYWHITNNETAYATFGFNYHVAFDANGGEFDYYLTAIDQYCMDGDIIQKPSDPVRKGYCFVGWSETVPCTVDSKDYFFYALWSPEHDHKTELLNIKAPTCIENGYTGYTFCETCNKMLEQGSVIPAFGHDYSMIKTVEPACRIAGSKTYTCTFCKDAYTETIPATGHSYTETNVTKEPTCTEEGLKHCRCHCDYEWDEPIVMLEHSYVKSITKAPTCTDEGTMKYTCSVCGDNYEESISANGHSYVESTMLEPTCLTEGIMQYSCSNCDDSYEEAISALGHSFTNYVSDRNAKCESDGTKTAKCDRCDTTDTITDEGSAHGHSYRIQYSWGTGYGTCYAYARCNYDWSHEVEEKGVVTSEVLTPPTCDKQGITRYTATFSNTDLFETITRDIRDIPATGNHSFTNYTSDNNATCLEDGTKTAKCDNCNSANTIIDEGSALGHELIHHDEKPSTCTIAGYKAYDTCSRCEYTTYEELPLVAHTPSEAVIENSVAGNCKKQGECDEVTYCAVCHTELTRTRKQTGFGAHKAAPSVIENRIEPTCTTAGSYDKVAYCSLCGNRMSKQTISIDPTEHHFVTPIFIQQPTCTKVGYKGYQCDCGTIDFVTEIPAKGHSFDEWRTVRQSTEYEEGQKEHRCTVCGLIERQPTEKLPQTELVLKEHAHNISGNYISLGIRAKDVVYLTASEDVQWSSSNNNIVNVDGNGTITTLKRGTATITAHSVQGNKTATCTVTVSYTWWQWLIRIFLLGFIWY